MDKNRCKVNAITALTNSYFWRAVCCLRQH